MRSPVNEPGPDIKVISVISLKSLLISWSFSCIQERSFSARSLPKSYMNSVSFNLRMVFGLLVSKYSLRGSWLDNLFLSVAVNVGGRSSVFED